MDIPLKAPFAQNAYEIFPTFDFASTSCWMENKL